MLQNLKHVEITVEQEETAKELSVTNLKQGKTIVQLEKTAAKQLVTNQEETDMRQKAVDKK